MTSPEMLQQLDSICRRFRIAALYVFGSRAGAIAGRLTGQGVAEQSESDVDIGVLTERDHRPAVVERVRLAHELEDLLGASRVDLTILREASPFLALDVVQGELLCCLNPEIQAEYELYVLRRAADLANFERERRKGILTGGAR